MHAELKVLFVLFDAHFEAFLELSHEVVVVAELDVLFAQALELLVGDGQGFDFLHEGLHGFYFPADDEVKVAVVLVVLVEVLDARVPRLPGGELQGGGADVLVFLRVFNQAAKDFGELELHVEFLLGALATLALGFELGDAVAADEVLALVAEEGLGLGFGLGFLLDDAGSVEGLVAVAVADDDLVDVVNLLGAVGTLRGVAVLAGVGGGEHAEVAFALGSAAVALGEWSLEEVKLVVKGELFVFLDVLDGEDAHADFAQDVPLARLAVGVTGVVDEAGDVAYVCGVDHFIVGSPHQVCARGRLVLLDAFFAQVGVDGEDFPHVLHDEGALGDEFSGEQAPALLFRLSWEHPGVLVQLEMPVLAKYSTGTSASEAFSGDAAVDAALPAVK